MLAFFMITLNFQQSILFCEIKTLGLLQHTLCINYISYIGLICPLCWHFTFKLNLHDMSTTNDSLDTKLPDYVDSIHLVICINYEAQLSLFTILLYENSNFGINIYKSSSFIAFLLPPNLQKQASLLTFGGLGVSPFLVQVMEMVVCGFKSKTLMKISSKRRKFHSLEK